MPKHHHHVHCPNRACDFAKATPYGQGLETYCPRCRTELIHQCPECNMPLSNLQRGYCSWCGASTLIDVEQSTNN